MAANHGARLTRIYTDPQRQAMLKAHLVDGMSIADAERAAMAGRLGLPPFGRRRFGYNIIREGRETFEAKNDEALEAGTAKALRDAQLANLKALRGLPVDADPEKRARLAKALADAQRARGPVVSRAKAKAKAGAVEAETPRTPQPPDVLGELVNLARSG